ncbi:phage major tail tube protein [Gracilibacillus sp. YIM 98692]|uniref:phage major tail tube protein n=1 Tax=Gracilibacillus sp. YIM 98692 TaxID=2663532 RepID=UPI0013D75A49|nr:phage major tail tube protein [Gracilibacillus sp. YIM 98692]
MTNPIPEKVINYNVYDDTDKLVGITSEVTLPNFEAMTETMSGAGIAGEYESATPGHFASQTIEIPFKTITDQSFSLLKNRGRSLVLRAAQQSYDMSEGRTQSRPLKITLRGQPKGVNLGTMSVGGMTETTNSLEILYVKIELDGRTLLEYDKLNFVYIIDGEDILGNIRNMI